MGSSKLLPVSLKKEVTVVDRTEADTYVKIYIKETDEELCERLRKLFKELGRLPKKEDMPGAYYVKKRLGPWPRALEKAGLKPVSAKVEQKRERYKEKKRRIKEIGEINKSVSQIQKETGR